MMKWLLCLFSFFLPCLAVHGQQAPGGGGQVPGLTGSAPPVSSSPDRYPPRFGRFGTLVLSANVSGGKPLAPETAGGKGGKIFVFLGDPSAELREEDFTSAPKITAAQQVRVDTSPFRIRGADRGSVLWVAGKATIECRGHFGGKIVAVDPAAPAEVTLVVDNPEPPDGNWFKGSMAHLYRGGGFDVILTPPPGAAYRDGGSLIVRTTLPRGTLRLAADGGNCHNVNVRNSTKGGDGGEIWLAGPQMEIFWASANGGDSKIREADGGDGNLRGGNGGLISISSQILATTISPAARIEDGIDPDGLAGALSAAGGRGGRVLYRQGDKNAIDENDSAPVLDGGKGGKISVVTETLIALSADASGGDGNSAMQRWRKPGSGGDGGTVYVQASQWSQAGRNLRVIADGGAGGGTGYSADECDVTEGRMGEAKRKELAQPLKSGVWSQPGANGGHGGTIEIVHQQAPLHHYPPEGYDPSRKSGIQAVAFSAPPEPSRPHFGRHALLLNFGASGGAGGVGGGGWMLFTNQDGTVEGHFERAARGGDGGAGGVVKAPDAWLAAIQQSSVLRGGRGGDGGWGADGGERMDGDAGADGGDGGQPGTLNGMALANQGGVGGNGGQGGDAYRSDAQPYNKGGDGGRGGNAGSAGVDPGNGGEGGDGSKSTLAGDPLVLTYEPSGEDGEPGGVGGQSPQEQVVWKKSLPFSTMGMLAVDANWDKEVTFEEPDRTTKEEPFEFWLNDDRDLCQPSLPLLSPEIDPSLDPLTRPRIPTSSSPSLGSAWPSLPDADPLTRSRITRDPIRHQTDVPASERAATDAQRKSIEGERDLEDLARLWLQCGLPAVAELGGSQPLEYRISMEAVEGTPALNLFRAESPEGNNDYLKDLKAARRQLEPEFSREFASLSGSAVSPSLPPPTGDNPTGLHHFLFEGVSPGLAALYVDTCRNGQVVSRSDPLYVRLMPVQKMYDTWTVGSLTEHGVKEDEVPRSPAEEPIGKDETRRLIGIEGNAYLIFIHGWNMSPFFKDSFAATLFKRMRLAGYSGKLGVFHWPTFYQTESWLGYGWVPELDFWNYDYSERNAWLSGAMLAAIIRQKAHEPNVGGVHLIAHSMGNVVAGEALRTLGAESVDCRTYVAMQAAVSAHAWDPTTKPRDFTAYQLQGLPPDVYANYWQDGVNDPPSRWKELRLPNYFHPSKLPLRVRCVNFANAKDYALDAWQTAQYLKPVAGYGYSEREGFYFSEPEIPTKTDRFGIPIFVETKEALKFPADRSEVFAFAAESHSYALGQETGVGGAFQENVNLEAAPYHFVDDREDHSGQFHSTVQHRWNFWKKVVQSLNISTTP
jgi:hypothetical protein